MQNIIFISLVCYILGLMSFSKILKHLLNMLISLEFLVLVIFLLVICNFYSVLNSVYLSMFYLIFSVCEGALGLTILVIMARSFGSDYFNSFSLMM